MSITIEFKKYFFYFNNKIFEKKVTNKSLDVNLENRQTIDYKKKTTKLLLHPNFCFNEQIQVNDHVVLNNVTLDSETPNTKV